MRTPQDSLIVIRQPEPSASLIRSIEEVGADPFASTRTRAEALTCTGGSTSGTFIMVAGRNIKIALAPGPHLAIGPAEQEFCARHDLASYLPRILQIIQECFSAATNFRGRLEYSRDLPEDRWLVIHFDVRGSFDELIQQYDRCSDVLAEAIPYPQSDLFSLDYVAE